MRLSQRGMTDVLKKIGMTDSEIQVFEALASLGSAPASVIAKDTGIHRTNLYDILARLEKKGLVSSVSKNNVKVFSILEPKNLLSLLEKQKKEIEDARPGLMELISAIKPGPSGPHGDRISIFQGREGLGFFYDRLVDIARSEDEIMIIASSEAVLSVFNYYFLNLSKRIRGIKVRGRMIANRRIIRSSVMKRILRLAELDLRFLPSGYVSPVAVFVFKDIVGFCNFTENPFVILIDDRLIAKSYKRHFEGLWRKAES